MTDLRNFPAISATQQEYTESAEWTRWAPWSSKHKTIWHRRDDLTYQANRTLCGHMPPSHAITFYGSIPTGQECKCCRDVQQRRRAREQATATGKRYLTHRERVSSESEQRFYL